MSDLKVGVIGSGGRGWLAQNAHKPDEGSRIVACCDINEKTLERNKNKYGDEIFTTQSPAALLKQDLDAVMICSPDHFHEEHALLTLDANLPFFMEKPMAITIEGCDEILTKAKEKNLKIFIGHNMRYMTIIQKMKKLIDEGAIGEVRGIWCRHFISYGGDAYFRDWHSESENTTSMLLQKAAHDFDVMHWLTNANTERVSAFGNLSVYNRCGRRAENEPGDSTFRVNNWPPLEQNGFSPKMDIEDQTTVNMMMENGIIGSYMQCHFTPDATRNYTVIGTEGRLENIGDGAESPIFLWNKRSNVFKMLGDEIHYPDKALTGGHGGADAGIVPEFLAYIRGEIDQTIATPKAARMSVATGCMATRSLREGGQPYDIPSLPEGV
jgi:predicted dehydrogenase